MDLSTLCSSTVRSISLISLFSDLCIQYHDLNVWNCRRWRSLRCTILYSFWNDGRSVACYACFLHGVQCTSLSLSLSPLTDSFSHSHFEKNSSSYGVPNYGFFCYFNFIGVLLYLKSQTIQIVYLFLPFLFSLWWLDRKRCLFDLCWSQF